MFAFLNVPLRYLTQLAGSTLLAFRHGIRAAHSILKLYGLIRGHLSCFSILPKRLPVSVKTYRAYRKIKRTGMIPLDKVFETPVSRS